MNNSKILIVDDHLLFGLGLKELLAKQETFTVFGPLKELNEINAAIHANGIELLLLDINLNGTNGIDLAKHIKSDFPQLKIIMLTMYEHAVFLKQAKEMGLDGYLLKDCDSEILINGITTVMLGGKCFLNIENKQYSVAKDSFGEKLKLSDREIEIAQQICKGLNNAEIAEKLILSYHTIKTHRKNIYTKLGISNITELIEILQS